MTTFAKSSFSAASYAAFRPTYPLEVFRTVLTYHRGPKNLCVDVGTGHGLVARTLSPYFKRVVGIDPSTVMIKQAIATTQEQNVEFQQGSAEDLGFVADGSVDMIVAGQAAHWFDYSKVWPEIKRSLRSGGTVAFWGYKDNVFVDYPKASKILDHYCYGHGDETMGAYWEPGRFLLRDRLQVVIPPPADFEDITRLEYEPGTNGPNSGTLGDLLMHKRLSLGAMEGYFRTFSSYHSWMEAHPDRIPKAKGGPGDVADEMFEKMLEAEPEWNKEGENWRDKEIESEWGSVILMARKK